MGRVEPNPEVVQKRDNEGRISKLGARTATIGTGDLAYAREFEEKYGIRFPRAGR